MSDAAAAGIAPESGPVVERREASPPRSRTNMALVLTTVIPGLGHLFYGDPVTGALGLLISLLLILHISAYAVFGFLALASSGPVVPCLLWFLLLGVFGLVYTGFMLKDAVALAPGVRRGMTRLGAIALLGGLLLTSLSLLGFIKIIGS